jgi:nitroreductase
MTRRFSPDPLPLEDVLAWCDLARRAPSAGYSQGTHFLVLHEAAVQRFWDLTGADRWFSHRAPGVLNAPVLVLPLADPEAYSERYRQPDKRGDPADWPVPFWLTDTAMATQNLLLIAEDRGVGALFFGIFRNERRLLDGLAVPGRVRALGAVALGHRAHDDRPSGTPTKRARRESSEVLHVGDWSGKARALE